jgi:hypothetical protein
MPTTQAKQGITNGHWERSESRAAWLLLLARLGVVELRTLGEMVRHAGETAEHPPLELVRSDEVETPVAAE